MEKYKRFAVYYAPRPGDFAERAAAWLGWDAALGHQVDHPTLTGLPIDLHDATREPRKYGFHGTIRAPFRLGPDVDFVQVDRDVAMLAARLPKVRCQGLQLENIHGFLALTPTGNRDALMELGAQVVEGTNHLRAPLSAAEVARRRPESLTERQRELMDLWGYPGVMEEFQFHLTLTGRLAPEVQPAFETAARDYFGPVLPDPFWIEDICLFGEAEDGSFHLLHRYALTG